MVQRHVWSFYESLDSGERSDRTKVEREVAAICDLRQEVNSGGFDAYFRYWGGDTAETALAAIGSMLGTEWAAVLSEAMAQFGTDYPATPSEREALLTDVVSESLDKFDERYFYLEASTDADALLGAELTRGR